MQIFQASHQRQKKQLQQQHRPSPALSQALLKRLLLLLCLLLIGGAIAVCAIGASVSSKQDAVTLTSHPLYGDPAAAKGATVELLAHLDEHLRWDVTYPIGGETKTDYRFSMRSMTFDRILKNA